MASVFNTASSRHRHQPEDYLAGESRSIQTVREKILQKCIKSFYSASCQLQTYQDQRQKFVISDSFKEVSDLEPISGLLDHDSFKSYVKNCEVQKVLHESGLTKYEIKILCEEYSETIPPSGVHLPDDVAARNQLTTLQAVLKKLSERESVLTTQNSKQPQNFAGAVELSRIEYEDALREGALSRHPNEVLSSVATSALVKRQLHRQPAVHPQHPLNHLTALEQELFADPERVDQEKGSSSKAYIQRGSKRRQVQVDAVWEGNKNEKFYFATCELKTGGIEPKKVKLFNEQSSEIDRALHSESHRVGSLWDVKDTPSNSIKETSIHNANRRVAKKSSAVCAKELHKQESLQAKNMKKKDFSKGFVSLPNLADLVPLSQISDSCIPRSRLSAEFPNYQSGNPSRTLYLKNLCNQTAPEDLVNIFGHFDTGEDRVTYRLLRGKMRGQAFVKFPTVESAQEAFNACLGYMMREKPLVIEFGKEKT